MKISFLLKEEVPFDFYPFTVLKNIEDLRFGLYTNKERWVSLLEKGLGEKINFSLREEADILVDPRVVPDQSLLNFFWGKNISVEYEGETIVKVLDGGSTQEFKKELLFLENKIGVLKNTAELIKGDIVISKPTLDITTVLNDEFTQIYNASECYISKDVTTHNATLNAENGPIYIGKNVKISEYAVVYGPAIIQDNTVIAPHTTIRGGCIIGKNCVVSGELKNVIMLGSSNKGHYGYLGDSIVGEFCNIGAGTSCSNIKNNFHNVKVYNKKLNGFEDLGVQKVGSFIGAFSTTAVNTVFNTGTTVGVMCNVFGSLSYPKYMPCFSWGTEGRYHQAKYKETAEVLLSHKDVPEWEKKEILNKLEEYYLASNI